MPTPTPVPTDTPRPQPTDTPATTVGKIGQKVTASGISLTVNSIQRVDKMTMSGFTLTPDQPGFGYVIVDVTIENTSRDQASYNPLYFHIKDSDGYEYNVTSSLDPKALKTGRIARGEKARGTVALAVPKNAHGLVLEYRPLDISLDAPIARIALD
ncbi:MAG: DUF4352 domain-containing protein [Chloroflexi bacterium]|nr:DUF4352 domain-containing protein [Chloroflexota bacterium]